MRPCLPLRSGSDFIKRLPRHLGFLHYGRSAAQRSVLASRAQLRNRGPPPTPCAAACVAAYIQFPRPATLFPVPTAHLAAHGDVPTVAGPGGSYAVPI